MKSSLKPTLAGCVLTVLCAPGQTFAADTEESTVPQGMQEGSELLIDGGMRIK